MRREIRRRSSICVGLTTGLLLVLVSVTSASAPEITPPEGQHTGIPVTQPIEFPHNLHVKENQINCLYCHSYARRSQVAGIPPLSKCMGCHKLVGHDKPEVQKLIKHWEGKQSPDWKKVHDLPDFVHFTHQRHLKTLLFDRNYPIARVGEICALCHGPLSEMTVANKRKPLTMGWCVECHQNNSGPGDCWKCHK